MARRILLAFVVTMLCMWSNSFAETQYSAAYGQCMAKANSATALMRRCTGEEIDRLDAELNSLYKKIMSKLDQKIKEESADPSSLYRKELEQAKKDLLAAQRAWIRYRDADSSFLLNISSYGGGTLGSFLAGARHLKVLASRVQDLRGYWKELAE